MAPETLREFYEFEADQYRITPAAEPAWHHRRLLVERLLPRERQTRVLDAGCGDGAMSAELSRLTGAPVVGVDLAAKRVRYGAATTQGVRFVQGSTYALPFASDAFSLVVCADVLEHLDEPEATMRELLRVSSRHVLITVPYAIKIEKTLCPHCRKEYYLYGHQHSFGREGIERLCGAAGGRVLRFEHVIPMFECRRYRLLPFLKWFLWDHFKNTGTLGALIEKTAPSRSAGRA
jgi:ubiquinone/menaquinone biosynthesis C-methylase UbiE